MEPKWYLIAQNEIGIKELPGSSANHPRILEYHSVTTLRATDDETPWCSSFVNWCMKQAGFPITGSAAAKSWLAWGEPCEPRKGAITVIRLKGSAGIAGHHVGFLENKQAHTVTLLGGNQSNAVNRLTFSLQKYDILGCRWPKEMIET